MGTALTLEVIGGLGAFSLAAPHLQDVVSAGSAEALAPRQGPPRRGGGRSEAACRSWTALLYLESRHQTMPSGAFQITWCGGDGGRRGVPGKPLPLCGALRSVLLTDSGRRAQNRPLNPGSPSFCSCGQMSFVSAPLYFVCVSSPFSVKVAVSLH